MAYCPTCGAPPNASPERIAALEHEIQVLTEQSMTAANKLAEQEEEIRSLRAQQRNQAAENQQLQQHAKSASVDASTSPLEAQQQRPAGLTRFASFRYGSARRNPSTATTASGISVDLGELQTQLNRETSARQEAEKKAETLNAELEDLSQQLFEQANEMVATERRARSKLEERVQVLEGRDRDKTKRLERIEGALKRLERVKALLGT